MALDGPEPAEGHRAHAADGSATAWLSAATAVGALTAAVWQLGGGGDPPFLPQNFTGSLLVRFGAGLVAAVLLVAAWALTARQEGRLGIRRQRGAMAALAGLAVFSVPFVADLVFSPALGTALILLAVRTRDLRTAATGLTALGAAVVLAAVPDLPAAAAVLGLVAVAAASVAVQQGRAAARSRKDEPLNAAAM